MQTKKMTVEQGKRCNISRFPNFHRSGSIKGMKKLYYGKDALLVRRTIHLQRDFRTKHIQSGNNLTRYDYEETDNLDKRDLS